MSSTLVGLLCSILLLRNVIVVLMKLKNFLLIGFISLFSFHSSVSYAENFDKIRNKAISIIKAGQTNKGLGVLETLASKGDLKSIIIAGSLFLNGKNIPRDYKRAHFWFKKASEQCDQKSILILEKYFYKRRGSEFFDPQKIDFLKSECLKKNNFNRQIVKNKSQKNKTIKNEKSKTVSKNNNRINTEVTRSWQNIAPQYGKIIGIGSGFAINQDGYFLTNHHVIDGCTSVNIRYNNLHGTARVINSDENFDAAILKANALTPYFANFDNSQYIAGEKLYAAGFPAQEVFGKEMSFSEGMLTNPETSKSRVRWFEGSMLISIPIASGNSGGPVMNKYGAIRGMIVGGWDIEKIRKRLKKDKIYTSNVTFNIMTSGNLLKKWLDNNRVVTYEIERMKAKLDSDVIGLMAKKFIGFIECVKDE